MSEVIRVLQVVTHMNRGGLETMLMNYYRHIDRDNVQFDFLVHREARADYDDEIEQLGGRIYRISRLIPWSNSYRKELGAFFKNHPEYKIIHVHQDCLSGVVLKMAKEAGIPVRIAHSHSSSQDKNLKYPIKLYYKRMIPKYATQLFACGKAAGDWMFGGAPYQIINNAIDLQLYRYQAETAETVRKELGIPLDAFVVGHVGRFSTPKNHSFLIDVFSEIYKQRPNSMLMLVGDGELRVETEKKVHGLGLEKNVVFTGVRSDVPQLLQATDVFVFPSLYEGLPVTMIEAQAAGLSCFISDKVPADCILTPNVQQLPLTELVDAWAYRILAASTKKADYFAKIAETGFDIRSNAKQLQEYYLGVIQ